MAGRPLDEHSCRLAVRTVCASILGALPFLFLAGELPLFGQTSAGAVLRWGGDAEGGAPFEFQDPANPRLLIGFEVEIMEAVGRILGRPTQFVQNQWDGLIPGLERGNYDLIVSGLEITPDRTRVIRFSRPYYVTFEQLAVREENDGILTLEDCRGKKVGTLKSSLAQRILEARGDLEVLSYDGQINAYEDLLNGRLDAVLMDHIIALYVVASEPGLKMVGPPIGRLEIGIGVRKEDTNLLAEVNAALDRMIRSGELRRILEHWNLWTPLCAEMFGNHTPGGQPAAAFERYLKSRAQRSSAWERTKQYISYLPLLGKGAFVTLELSVIGMALAIALGLLLSLSRLYAPPFVRFLALAFIEIIRGTPLLIQLFLIFYGLPHIGIRFSPMVAAILGLALN